MQFRIADTFIDSLAKLPDQVQKAVKTTAFDFTESTGATSQNLLKLKIVGLWKDRPIDDSAIFAGKLRDEAQNRGNYAPIPRMTTVQPHTKRDLYTSTMSLS